VRHLGPRPRIAIVVDRLSAVRRDLPDRRLQLVVDTQTHGHRCRQRCDQEWQCNHKPCYNTEVEATEQVKDKDRGTTKEHLAHNREPRKIGNVKAKLDGQEQCIEKCRGAQIIYEFHFRALCIEHKK